MSGAAETMSATEAMASAATRDFIAEPHLGT